MRKWSYFDNHSQLARMNFHTRLVMTLFLVFMLIATGVSIFMSYERTRLTEAGATDYYRGNEQRMLFPKEPAELMENTHFHLFIMPLIFLTITHLFALSAWGRRWKTFVIASCFIFILLHIAKPWLIRYASASFGTLVPINTGLLGLTMLLCILVPIYEMWFLKKEVRSGPKLNERIGKNERTHEAIRDLSMSD